MKSVLRDTVGRNCRGVVVKLPGRLFAEGSAEKERAELEVYVLLAANDDGYSWPNVDCRAVPRLISCLVAILSAILEDFGNWERELSVVVISVVVAGITKNQAMTPHSAINFGVNSVNVSGLFQKF